MASARTMAVKGMKFADAGCRVLEFKSDFIEAAVKQAKAVRKAVMKFQDTTEEFVDKATYAVKKHPMKAVCCTFGTAFTIGALSAWFAKRNR